MLLKIGSKGEDVKKVQIKLGILPDGIFGKNTEQVVKKWQSNNKLVPDGIIDDKTWKMMFEYTNTNTFVLANLKKLQNIVPNSVLFQIPEITSKFNINTTLRLAHFLSQCAHESINFKFVEENLNYSSSGLKRVFGKYFPGNLSESYAGKPQKIANRVYSNRMGNGNEYSGDGYKYRGRGYIQITGKVNYAEFDKFVPENILEYPELVSYKYPLSSAAFFFSRNNLWQLCDKGPSINIIKELTRKINGGYNGLDDRIAKFNKFYSILNS